MDEGPDEDEQLELAAHTEHAPERKLENGTFVFNGQSFKVSVPDGDGPFRVLLGLHEQMRPSSEKAARDVLRRLADHLIR